VSFAVITLCVVVVVVVVVHYVVYTVQKLLDIPSQCKDSFGGNSPGHRHQ
jgi:hypothetical protein